MTERDKLIAQAERARNAAAVTCPASRHVHDMAEALVNGSPYPMLTEEPGHCGESMLAVLADLWVLRALAAQHPVEIHPLDGPKCEHGYPLSAPSCPLCGGRPQASAPADHTAAADQNREAGNDAALNAAVGVTPDLDALVAEAGRSRVWPIPNMHDELCEAITDLRAEVERAKAQRDEAWQAFTRLRRAYSMVRYPTLTEELRLLYDAADAVAAGKSEGKA